MLDNSLRLKLLIVLGDFSFLLQKFSHTQPPSTLLMEPVMNEAASLSRNTASWAASSEVPTRGIEVVMFGSPWIAIALSSNGVEMVPLKTMIYVSRHFKNKLIIIATEKYVVKGEETGKNRERGSHIRGNGIDANVRSCLLRGRSC